MSERSEQVPYQPPYSRLDAKQMRGRDEKPFIVDEDLLAAANVALALERPLLLTGEPGCGKTDFAFAAASSLVDDSSAKAEIRKPLEYYVRSETRARDLLYSYDAVRRFGDAQTGGEQGRQRAVFPQNYVTLEPLGVALTAPTRQVVLIDEIDKAPRDLPNDLLRELDQGWFEIPEIPAQQNIKTGTIEPGQRHLIRKMVRPGGVPKPLVVITSNVERQLPDAFLRRCVFFYIPFPSDERLKEILVHRFGDAAPAPLRNNAVALLMELRRDALGLTKKPATAELIDWVTVLLTVFDKGAAARRLAAALEDLKADNPVNWRGIPGIASLLKLREDLEQVAPSV